MASTSIVNPGVTAESPENSRTFSNLLELLVQGYSDLLSSSDIRQQSDRSLPNVIDMERARDVLLLAIHHLETYAAHQNGQDYENGGPICKKEFRAMLSLIRDQYGQGE